MSDTIALFYTTFPDSETAQKICRVLIEENLIACANVMSPNQAIYRWQGKIDQQIEVVAILKGRRDLAKKAMDRYLDIHPYTTPCWIEIPVTGVNLAYEKWLCN